ncbi:thioesterase family protein [Actinophytocola sp.]|uniref:thioesterase family protein n=1 Tax=Actinophytocola sp. TaxID=1872138 RepID=UPI002ED5E5AA
MFYEPLGDDRYASTVHTTGPWSPLTQHLGPPSALMVREMERLPARAPMVIARVTVEILGPVPVAELSVTASVDRPGRAVELLSASLSSDGRVVARARAWRIVRSDTRQVAADVHERLAPPSSGRVLTRPEGWVSGYLDIMEWRALSGSLAEPGPAVVWARQGVPLVGDEEPSGLQRLLTVADSGNGLSNRLDPRKWLFINTDLTVHVYREPVGEWVAMAAATAIGPEGVGTATTVLHDLDGPVGHGAQALLVRPQ